MTRVLLAWELGAGFGHVMALAHIARMLVPEHQVTLALRRVDQGSVFYRDLPVRVREAPSFDTTETLHLRAGRRFSARDYADILTYQGFAEPATLEPQLAAWDALLREVDPELCVADGSPALCLATRGRVATIATGAGFAVPPTHLSEFPVLQPQRSGLLPSDRILAAIHRVLKERGQSPCATLPAQLRVEAHLPRTLPELDPYRAARVVHAPGPLQRLPRAQPAALPASFVMYLDTRSPWRVLLETLSAMGYQGSAYIRGLSREELHSAQSAGLPVSAEPLDLAEHLSRVGLVIHHGGLNLASEALTAGRAQLLLPLHLEQALTARALVALGVAVHGSPRRGATREEAARFLEQAAALTEHAAGVARNVHHGHAGAAWGQALRMLGVPPVASASSSESVEPLEAALAG